MGPCSRPLSGRPVFHVTGWSPAIPPAIADSSGLTELSYSFQICNCSCRIDRLDNDAPRVPLWTRLTNLISQLDLSAIPHNERISHRRWVGKSGTLFPDRGHVESEIDRIEHWAGYMSGPGRVATAHGCIAAIATAGGQCPPSRNSHHGIHHL